MSDVTACAAEGDTDSSDSVGQLAAAALIEAASFLDKVKAEEEGGPEAEGHLADVSLRVAEAVARAPLQSCRRVLRPTDLDGRFETDSQRTFPLVEVAAWLLDEAVRRIQGRTVDSNDARGACREAVHRMRRASTLLSLAPNGQLGSRLNELLPYLRYLRLRERAAAAFQRTADEINTMVRDSLAVQQDPAFEAVARDCYTMRLGGDYDTLPAQMREVWAAGLVGMWRDRQTAITPLRPNELEQVAHALAHPRAAWARPPSIAGHWQVLVPEEALPVLALIGAWHRAGGVRAPWVLAHACDRVRIRHLACHGGVVLAEVQGRTTKGGVGIAGFLLADDAVHAVDGGSAWIHDLNDLLDAQLSTEAARQDYVRLFAGCVNGDEGPFQPIESADMLTALADPSETLQGLAMLHARPLMAAGFDEEGRRLYRAIVRYGGDLFSACFALLPDGIIEMVDDAPLATDLPIPRFAMEGLFVTMMEP